MSFMVIVIRNSDYNFYYNNGKLLQSTMECDNFVKPKAKVTSSPSDLTNGFIEPISEGVCLNISILKFSILNYFSLHLKHLICAL